MSLLGLFPMIHEVCGLSSWPFIRNEFGFTNGGPLTIPRLYNGRNRTFYFVEYQGFRQVLSATEVLPVPTAPRARASTPPHSPATR